MMAYLGEWIKHIVLLILLSTFLELLLPNSSMRRYVKLVVGLLLILVILTPLLQLFQFDFERLSVSVEQLLDTNKPDLDRQIANLQAQVQTWQDESLLEQVAFSWSQEIKEQVEKRFEVKIHDIQLDLAKQGEELQVEQVSLQLVLDHPAEELPTSTPPTAIKQIKPVVIAINGLKPQEKQEKIETSIPEEKNMQKRVLKYMEDEWNISVDKISCTWVREELSS